MTTLQDRIKTCLREHGEQTRKQLVERLTCDRDGKWSVASSVDHLVRRGILRRRDTGERLSRGVRRVLLSVVEEAEQPKTNAEVARELRAVRRLGERPADAVPLRRVQRTTGRDPSWLMEAVRVFAIEAFQIAKGEWLVSSEDARRLIAEADRCSHDLTAQPGDPTVDEIYSAAMQLRLQRRCAPNEERVDGVVATMYHGRMSGKLVVFGESNATF